MFRNIAMILALMAYSHICLSSPMPGPGHRKTHIVVHVPQIIKEISHHTVEHVPIYHKVPVIKEVPVFKEVPVIKHVPVIKTVPMPIVKTIDIEKPVLIPVPYENPLKNSSWR